nr:hypothetical protein [Cellulosimicrobium sp. MM]
MLTIYSSSLVASSGERSITGLLLPFNEPGATSAGRVTASATSVTVPEDVSKVVLNIEHDGLRPVGRATSIEAREDGLHATFRIAATTAGNDLLEEVREGLRACLSVEVESPVIRDGHLLAGDLTGAGAVVRPAFPSASVYALAASDCGELPDPSAPVGDPDADRSASVTPTAPEAPSVTASEAPADDTTNTESESHVTDNVTAPADLVASAKNANTGKEISLHQASSLIASGKAQQVLSAALTDIPAGNGHDGGILDNVAVPQFLGELWSGKTYVQRYAPLVNHATFTPGTSGVVYGWRFTDKLSVNDWSGFPNEVPTSDVGTELVTANPAKLAGGWVFDRDLADSGNAGFIEAALRQATNDYARKIDNKVIARISSESTAVTGVAPVTGVAKASVLMAKGILNLINDEASLTPDFAIVGQDLYEELLFSKKDQVLEYLSVSVGFDAANFAGFKVVPANTPSLNGSVIVGSREALTLFEYAGAPVRVEALDVARGGIEVGLYGKWAIIAAGKGLVKVTGA